MATATKTIVDVGGPNPKSAYAITWDTLTSTNTDGSPVEMGVWSDRSIQIVGPFGAGTFVWQGSNDGSNWVTLTDPQGNAISKTAAGIENIEEVTRYMRPAVTSADGSTALVATLFLTGYRGY